MSSKDRVDTLIKQILNHEVEDKLKGIIDCDGWELDDIEVARIINALTTTLPLQNVFSLDFSNNTNITTFNLVYTEDDTNIISELYLDNNRNLKHVDLSGATYSFTKLSLKYIDQELVQKIISQYIGYNSVLNSSDHANGVFLLGDPDALEAENVDEVDHTLAEEFELINKTDFTDAMLIDAPLDLQLTASAEELVDGVNMRFWYTDSIINAVFKSASFSNGIILSSATYGLLLDSESKKLYSNKLNATLSYCSAIGIGTGISEIQKTACLNTLKECLDEILQHSEINEHSILIPINLNNSHWCLGQLSLNIITENNERKFDANIKLNVYDSLYSTFRDELIKKLNNEVFTKFGLVEAIKHDLNTVPNTKRQQDTYACGPITLDYMTDIIKNGLVPTNTGNEFKYTRDEIFALRIFHVLLPENGNLQHLQSNDLVNVQLLPPEVDRDTPQLTTQLSDILTQLTPDDKQSFVQTASQFVIFQKSLQTDTPCGNTEILTKIKILFNHPVYQGFACNIFTLNPKPDLIVWKENGIDKLQRILNDLLFQEYKAEKNTDELDHKEIQNELDHIISCELVELHNAETSGFDFDDNLEIPPQMLAAFDMIRSENNQSPDFSSCVADDDRKTKNKRIKFTD